MRRSPRITINVFTDGTTTGGGTWEGRILRDPTVVNDNDTPDVDESTDRLPNRELPANSHAHFGNGHVVGAFGATR